jgi:hypothetical protein
MNPKMRTYIRSSLIFCSFNTLAIIIHFVMHLLKGVTPLRAAKAIAIARFEDIDDEVKGLQYLEKLTFVRWIFFILTLTQSIKLFALSGIPWSQAWGCLYLASFLIVEVLILLHDHERSQTSTVSLLPSWMDCLRAANDQDLTSRIEHLRLYMEKVDYVCAFLAAATQFCVMSWVVWQICLFPMVVVTSSLESPFYITISWVVVLILLLFGVIAGTMLFFMLAIKPWIPWMNKEYSIQEIRLALAEGPMEICMALAEGPMVSSLTSIPPLESNGPKD